MSASESDKRKALERSRIFNGDCPVCGAPAEGLSSPEVEGHLVVVRMQCTKEDRRWTEYYKFRNWIGD